MLGILLVRVFADQVRTLRANSQGNTLRSVFKCPLPFRVDPTEKRVQFVGDPGNNGRYCTLIYSRRRNYRLSLIHI